MPISRCKAAAVGCKETGCLPVLTSASKACVPRCRQLNPATPPAAIFSTAAAAFLADAPAATIKQTIKDRPQPRWWWVPGFLLHARCTLLTGATQGVNVKKG